MTIVENMQLAVPDETGPYSGICRRNDRIEPIIDAASARADGPEKGFSRHLAEIVGGQGAVSSYQLSVLMRFARYIAVDDLDSERFELLTEGPW